jgi:eukaryotic-like serine/threonine-protein kinase
VLERELGRGGMATVYLAYDRKHDRRVAFKVLHSELASTLGPARFQREIKLAARLQHPNILTVHDSGDAGGQLWFTMPYVEGESLRDRLRREPRLPLEAALRIAADTARALDFAHRHGVIHRDIKPENLLLTGDGSTLVADFGIARSVAEQGEHLTQTGMSIGTPAYMSPEQTVGNGELDARTDVYSLAAVLYEMLAGEQPFIGATMQAVIAKRLSGEVPAVRRLRPNVPEQIERAITRALAVVPGDRFDSAAEFARALQSSSRPARRMPPVLLASSVAILAAVGVLLALRRGRPAAPSGNDAGTVLAVLPFENLGDSADAYFAEGVANDVRTKLARLDGITVIARGSSNEYRGTSKAPEQIARDLGANYLLAGTVQWEKRSDGSSRVRVTPELVRVPPGGRPRTQWGEQFDAAMTGVFDVQADIAGRVAEALNVALGDSVEQELAERPTHSLAAYDAFLRGEAVSQGMTVFEIPPLRQALAAYQQAVALDTTFVEAWARLAYAHAVLYYVDTPTPARADSSWRAADRAFALAPNRPEGHMARGAYYVYVRWDARRAVVEDSAALALAPKNAFLLAVLAWDELFLARWKSSREHFEQAIRLDPRSAFATRGYGQVLLYTRQFSEAERALDRALELAPANLTTRGDRAVVALAQGDLVRARAIFSATPKDVPVTALMTYWTDQVWVLDEAQQQALLALTPSAFEGDRGKWGLMLAQAYALRGDTARARAYADSACLAFQREPLRAEVQDALRQGLLGLTLAYLGRKAEASRIASHAVALVPATLDAYTAPALQHQLARVYVLVGEHEKAIDILDALLEMPYILSPAWLAIDPNFAPLRGNPRFELLLGKS